LSGTVSIDRTSKPVFLAMVVTVDGAWLEVLRKIGLTAFNDFAHDALAEGTFSSSNLACMASNCFCFAGSPAQSEGE